jgi:aminoglycoside 6-adenylyltransferase
MSNIKEAYGEIILKITNWAENHDDIRTVSITEVYAGTSNPVDDFSDLNFWIVTTNPKRYLLKTDWVESLGKPWLTFVGPTLLLRNQMERRVLFEDGLDVDFAIDSIETIQQFIRNELPPDGVMPNHGIKVLIDKDGMLSKTYLSVEEFSEFSRPTENEFLNLVNDFLYHFVWIMKRLYRNEILAAKSCVDSYMKWRLLKMVEWHALAIYDNYDNTFTGHFIEKWADPQVVRKLKKTDALYDKGDIKYCLREAVELFSTISVETAKHWGYQCPVEDGKQVVQWVNQNLF